MKVIDKQEQLKTVIEEICKELRELGDNQLADDIMSGDYNSKKFKDQYAGKINKLSDDIDVRNKVLSKLESEKQAKCDNGDDVAVAKYNGYIKEVYNGTISSRYVKKLLSEEEDKLAAVAVTQHMDSLQHIIEKYNFWQAESGNLYWYYQPEEVDEYGNRQWKTMKDKTLMARFPLLQDKIRQGNGLPDYKPFAEFCKRIVASGRYFSDVIQSYNKSTRPGTLNLMNANFCEPHPEDEKDYHWVIDALFESITGGMCEDTGLYLQRLILSKWQHPDNIYLPSVVMNDDGETGKSLFVATFIKRLFSGNVADNCNIDHVTGKFNSVIAGKAVVFVNETTRDRVDSEQIKRFLGSPTFIVEEKFVPPYYCDNTALLITASNMTSGGIPLSGTGSDRRYSIFSSKTNINEVVVRYMAEHEGVDITLDEAAAWIKQTGSKLLHDREQVSKWLSAMIERYGDVTHVEQNHSAAYQVLLDKQRAVWLDTVEEVFTDPTFIGITDNLLKKLVKYVNNGEHIHKGRNFVEQVNKLIADKGYPVELRQGTQITAKDGSGTFRRKTWVPVGLSHGGKAIDEEDFDKYGYYNEHGNWVWAWKH